MRYLIVVALCLLVVSSMPNLGICQESLVFKHLEQIDQTNKNSEIGLVVDKDVVAVAYYNRSGAQAKVRMILPDDKIVYESPSGKRQTGLMSLSLGTSTSLAFRSGKQLCYAEEQEGGIWKTMEIPIDYPGEKARPANPVAIILVPYAQVICYTPKLPDWNLYYAGRNIGFDPNTGISTILDSWSHFNSWGGRNALTWEDARWSDVTLQKLTDGYTFVRGDTVGWSDHTHIDLRALFVLSFVGGNNYFTNDGVGWHCSVDATSGTITTAYSKKNKNWNLKIAELTDEEKNTWSNETIDSGKSGRITSSVRYNPETRKPCVAYVMGNKLWYAQKNNNGVWNKTLVDTKVDRFCELKFLQSETNEAKPYIAYSKLSEVCLAYVD